MEQENNAAGRAAAHAFVSAPVSTAGHALRTTRASAHAHRLRLCAPRRAVANARRTQVRCQSLDNDDVLVIPNRKRNLEIQVEGVKIVYDYYPGEKGPIVMYLPGFFYARSRTAKVNALQTACNRRAQGFLALDYYGTDRSGGEFANGTVSRWVKDVVTILDQILPNKKVVLVGSGIGGWVMLHVAIQRPEAVVGLVGLSADPDFTERLLMPALSETQREELDSKGIIDLTWGYRKYPISKKLVDDGRNMLVLTGEKDSLPITCPVRLIQGLADEELPSTFPLEIVEKIRSTDVNVTFVKYGDHALENDSDFKLMINAVKEVSDLYFEYDLRSPTSG
ncbi:Mycophenolic acid acyl-glucuronide esterase, mitochondrial [Porphyridium purpureum]|uniref:Palmitoyl-protein thioesterase ABHD10, mitochondrial n=1 Tax=Porphyridium purpureum TaxID=35688 RepID=A0A5J4YWA8_PORPP|nr:Mycophenolic acid acyl-glucuronide esterase, mitochondrial [Porphyridium purpureum]|eukprot:POR8189..scf209_3